MFQWHPMTYGPQYGWVHVPKNILTFVFSSMVWRMCQRVFRTCGCQYGWVDVPKGTWDLWLPVWSGACAKYILILMVTIMGRSIMPKTLSNIWSPVWSRACTNRTCMKHYLLLICCIKITVSWLE